MESLKIKLSPVFKYIIRASGGGVIALGFVTLLFAFCEKVNAASDKPDSISTLVVRARAAKTEAERQEYFSRLSSMTVATESDVAALLDAMSEEKMVALSARTLRKLKYEDRQLAPTFIKGLDSRDKRVKLLSIEMLGRFKSKEAAPALMRIAETTKIKQVFASDGGMLVGKALLSLGDIGEEKAIPIMMARLKEFGENGDVAGVALQRMGKKAVLPLVTCAQDNSDKEKQKDCTYLLRGIKDKEAAPTLLEVAQNTGGRKEVRKNAVEALGYIGEENSIRALTQMYKSTEDSVLRGYILSALINSKNKDGIGVAIIALKDTTSENRATAADLLKEIGNDSAVPALENALGDPNKEVRITVARALKKITGKDYDWKTWGRK